MATQTEAVSLVNQRETLTPRQMACYEAIKKLLLRGVGPSFEEIADALNISSTSSVFKLVRSLEKKGYVRRPAGRYRTWEIL